MKRVLSAILIAMITLAFSACSKAGTGAKAEASGTITVYNWGDYIDEELLDMFTQKTGITVVYDVFATNEDMYSKLKAGGVSYDVVIPSDYMIEKMRNENLLQKIDLNNIPNFKHLSELVKGLAYDEKNEYSVPYMWGTFGILYNRDMVTEPVDSWDIFWDPTYKGQIFMYDSVRDTMGVALKKLGYSINTIDTAQLLQAKDILIEQKPLTQAYVGDPVKDKMIGNEGALAAVYSGDAIYCMQENPRLAYVVPKEGSNKWFDAMVVPVGAKNKAGAEAFINFMCDPQIAAKNAEYIGYSTPNTEALKLMDPEIINNPAYQPDQKIIDNCEIFKDLGDSIKEYDKIWTEILAEQ